MIDKRSAFCKIVMEYNVKIADNFPRQYDGRLIKLDMPKKRT